MRDVDAFLAQLRHGRGRASPAGHHRDVRRLGRERVAEHRGCVRRVVVAEHHGVAGAAAPDPVRRRRRAAPRPRGRRWSRWTRSPGRSGCRSGPGSAPARHAGPTTAARVGSCSQPPTAARREQCAMHLPDGVLGMAERGPDWADWVDRLPRLAGDLMAEWGLRADGWSMHGYCLAGGPGARPRTTSPVVLKVTFDGDDESEHEALALQHWDGDGAVRCSAPTRTAGRCCSNGCTPGPARRSGTSRRARSWPASTRSCTCRRCRSCAPSRRTSNAGSPSCDELPGRRPGPAPAGRAGALARRATSSPTPTAPARDPRRPALRQRARRRPGAVAGDRPEADDRRPALRGRADAVEPVGGAGAGDVRDGVRRRFHTLVDAAGLDEDRARDWVVVRRCSTPTGPPSCGDTRGASRTALTIAKAVQD